MPTPIQTKTSMEIYKTVQKFPRAITDLISEYHACTPQIWEVASRKLKWTRLSRQISS